MMIVELFMIYCPIRILAVWIFKSRKSGRQSNFRWLVPSCINKSVLIHQRKTLEKTVPKLSCPKTLLLVPISYLTGATCNNICHYIGRYLSGAFSSMALLERERQCWLRLIDDKFKFPKLIYQFIISCTIIRSFWFRLWLITRQQLSFAWLGQNSFKSIWARVLEWLETYSVSHERTRLPLYLSTKWMPSLRSI